MRNSPEPNPDILSAKQLAAYLHMHHVTVTRLLERGELPGQKIGWQWRTRRRDVDALLCEWPLPQQKRVHAEP